MLNEGQKINIVMFNMSGYFEWAAGVSNRNYHVLQTLLKDERVGKIIAIDYLPWTVKKVIKNYWYGYLTRPTGSKVVYQNLLTKACQVSEKLTVVSSVATYFSRRRFYQDLEQILLDQGIGDDFVVWSYNPLLVDYFDQLKARQFIFDAVDNWALHPAYVSIKEQLLKNYQVIASRAQIILAVAKELEPLFADNPRFYWIPNGIDYEHYQQKYSLIDKRIADIPHPIIGYIGIILGRIDLNIIRYLAEHNPDKSVVLVGSYQGRWRYWDKATVEELRRLPNVRLLGYVPYQGAPMYIQQFDVAIIPHDPATYVAATNPMKMYEYLACGKPVVATAVPGVEMFSEIAVATTPAEFNAKVQTALAEDNPEKQAARRALVLTHSWQSRVKQMLDIIIG